jgi:hypothetical protein
MILSAINISIGPIVNKKVGTNWGTANCEYLKDQYEEKKTTRSGKEIKYEEGWKKEACLRKKGMYNMEFTSFIFNICIGFSCGLLAFLHLLEAKKDFIPKTGLIGLICGVVGFVLSFVYVVYNGIVYTKYYEDEYIYKRDSEGAFAVLNGDKYICFYHDEPANYHSIIAKFSDLIKKQYNYDKDLVKSYASDEVQNCLGNPSSCQVNGKITGNTNCKKLYVFDGPIEEIYNKDISDRFLTTLILSLFVCLANIGLAFYGFLLFRNPDESQTKTDTNVANVQNPTSKFSVDQNLKS